MNNYKTSVEDFLKYGDLEDKILYFFDSDTLETLKSRAMGEIDHFNRLPKETKSELLLRLPIELLPKIRKDLESHYSFLFFFIWYIDSYIGSIFCNCSVIPENNFLQKCISRQSNEQNFQRTLSVQ